MGGADDSVTICYIKISPILPKSCAKAATPVFTSKWCFCNLAQKVTDHFGYFCKKYCGLKPSKFAQSGHTKLTRDKIPLRNVCFLDVPTLSFSFILKKYNNKNVGSKGIQTRMSWKHFDHYARVTFHLTFFFVNALNVSILPFKRKFSVIFCHKLSI